MTTLITLNFFCPSKKRDPTDSFGEENEEPSLGKNKCYYMASSVSGQDEPKRALWLALRAGTMEPSYIHTTITYHNILPAVSRKQNFTKSHLIKSFIDQVCSVKMAGYWPRSFLRVYGPQLRLGP